MENVVQRAGRERKWHCEENELERMGWAKSRELTGKGKVKEQRPFLLYFTAYRPRFF
jgi:hypothetical protein